MKHSHGGYTILEMIISITIITIMLGVVGSVFSLGKPLDTIRGDTDRFIAALANVRNRAFNKAQYQSVSSKCSLNVNTSCTTNANCISAKEGHCTNLSYPPLGYGIHIKRYIDGSNVTSYATFADFNNVDGALPYFDKATERMETVTSTAKFLFALLGGNFDQPNAASETEIIFNYASSTVTIYDNSGGWHMVDYTPTEQYQVRIEDFGAMPGCVKGKRGLVTVEGRAMRIYGALATCP